MLKRCVPYILIPLAVGIFLAAFSPAPAEAQMDCVFCSDCNNSLTGKLGHFAWDMNSPMQANQRGGGTHQACLGKNGQDYTCALNHPPCGGIGGGPLYDAPRHRPVLDAITSAVAGGDGLAAYRIVTEQPPESPFYFLAERRAIQVRGCADTVLAHIPLGHLMTEALLAAIRKDTRSSVAP